jgi:hypothetical protein
MEPISKVFQELNLNPPHSVGSQHPVVPLGDAGCYVEWTPRDLIDPHEMAEFSEQGITLLSGPCCGKILDQRWYEIDAINERYSGWSYLVQQIDQDTCEEMSGKLWWIDEEDLTFTGALRRRIPDASQIEILNPTDEREPIDFATTVPLWWRAKYG